MQTALAGCQQQAADADAGNIDTGLIPDMETDTMTKTDKSLTTISSGTKEELAQAEARYHAQRQFTLADAIDELRSGEVLGPMAMQIFDRVVLLHMDDWLERPVLEITRTDVLARWSRLWLHGQHDEARWFAQSVKLLRNYRKWADREIPFGDHDIFVNVWLPDSEEEN